MRQVNVWSGHRVYLGNARDARDLKTIGDAGIQAVVDLAIDEPPAILFRDVAYLRVPLLDGAENSAAMLKLAVSTVELLLREGVTTLVACSNGMSRSPSILAIAISRVSGCQPEHCVPDGPHDLSEGLWHDLLSCHDIP